MLTRIAGAAAAASFSLMLALASPAVAQQNIMKDCGAEYQAAKAANTLAGKDWNAYLTECRVRHAAQPTAQPAAQTPAHTPAPHAAQPAAQPATSAKAAPAPAAKTAPGDAGPAVFPRAVDPKYAKEPQSKQHMKTCVDQYKANKASNANGGMRWIERGGGYWSECSKRLKG